MVEENEGKPKENAGNSLFNQLSEVRPARTDVAVEDEVGDVGDVSGSLSQRMKLSPKMTDTQIVDKRLFPILKETLDWLNNLMVARVYPETLNPLRNIIIKHLLKEYFSMSFAEAVALAEVALTVALDGEGRLDMIHMFSKLSEASEEEGKGKLA